MTWNPIGDKTASARRKLDNPTRTMGAGSWGDFQRNQAEWQGAMQMDKFSHVADTMQGFASPPGSGGQGRRFSGPQTVTSSGGLQFTSPEKREWLGEVNRADRMQRTMAPALMSALGSAASSIFGGGSRGSGGGGGGGAGSLRDPFADSRAQTERMRLEQREDRNADLAHRRGMEADRSSAINQWMWGDRQGSGPDAGSDDPFTGALSGVGNRWLTD